jgi:trimeric autotransporter adhesin
MPFWILYRAAAKCMVASFFFVALACSGRAQLSLDPGAGGSGGAAIGIGIGAAGDAATAEGGAGLGGDEAPIGGGPSVLLTEIAVVPPESELVVGAQLPLVVMGTYSNGTQQDLTGPALFVSSDRSVATVSGRVVTARAAGQATITASVAALSANVTITVSLDNVIAVTVTTSKPTMSMNDGTQLKATASMAGGSTQDVTASVVWTSSDAKVARLIQTGFLVAMGDGVTTITASLARSSGSVQETVTGDTLTSYSISGAHVMRMGDQSTLLLIAHYAKNPDVTERDAGWQSSDTGVLTVSDAGLLEPVGFGTATISASLGTSVVASADILVTKATLQSIDIVGQNVYEFCNPPALKAIGTFSDGSSYDVSGLVDGWLAGPNVEVERVGSDQMRLKPSALGAGEIDVSVGDIQGSAMFTAVLGSPESITLQAVDPFPISASAVLGAFAQCRAPGPSFEVTSIVQWQSDNPLVVSISPAPDTTEANGVSVGTANIRGALPGFTIDPISVTIFDATPVALELDPDTANFESPGSFPMQAYGVYSDQTRYRLTSSCTWSSSDEQVATISNAPVMVGNLTLLSSGSLLITAKLGTLTAAAEYEVF